MNRNIKLTTQEIKALIMAWRIIRHDYSDCADKEVTLKIIDELLIGKCEELADMYDADA